MKGLGYTDIGYLTNGIKSFSEIVDIPYMGTNHRVEALVKKMGCGLSSLFYDQYQRFQSISPEIYNSFASLKGKTAYKVGYREFSGTEEIAIFQWSGGLGNVKSLGNLEICLEEGREQSLDRTLAREVLLKSNQPFVLESSIVPEGSVIKAKPIGYSKGLGKTVYDLNADFMNQVHQKESLLVSVYRFCGEKIWYGHLVFGTEYQAQAYSELQQLEKHIPLGELGDEGWFRYLHNTASDLIFSPNKNSILKPKYQKVPNLLSRYWKSLLLIVAILFAAIETLAILYSWEVSFWMVQGLPFWAVGAGAFPIVLMFLGIYLYSRPEFYLSLVKIDYAPGQYASSNELAVSEVISSSPLPDTGSSLDEQYEMQPQA